MGYQILMQEASTEYEGNSWLAYDRRLRLQAASSIDTTCWNLAFTNQAGANITSVYFTCQKIVSFLQAKCPACLSHDNYPLIDGSFADIGMSNKARDAPSGIVAMNIFAIIVHTILQSMISIIRPCFAQIVPISSWRYRANLSPCFHELMPPGTIWVLLDTVH